MRSAVLALLLIAVATSSLRAEPAEATATTGEARAHWKRGLAEHAAHDYAAASAEFAACYRLAQRRDCLFAWAQAARLAGDCDTASELYRRYLQGELSPRQVEAARSQLAVCEAELAARAGAQPRSEPAPVPAGPPAAPPPATIAAPRGEPAAPATTSRVEAPPGSPWYRDVWGDVLTGTGVAAIATGAVLYASARRDAAASAPSYDAYADRFRSAERSRSWAFVALGAGTALIAGGVLHMALRDDAPPPRVTVGVAAAPAQLTVAYSGAF
jgi:hypothetical protein